MYSRQKREQHEKSMMSYEAFARSDALSIADLLGSLYDVKPARKMWLTFAESDIREFERKNSELIADFIQKSESQRLPFLKRISKDSGDDVKLMFLVLTILGVVRAGRIMELRDRFRTILVPGRGNRLTTAAMFDFAMAVQQEFSYEWPSEIFDAIDLYDGHDDED